MDIFGTSGMLAVVIPFLVQLIKKLKFIGNKEAPLVAFALGIIGGLSMYKLGVTPEGVSVIQAVLAGIAIGGTSTGLYDVAKKLKRDDA